MRGPKTTLTLKTITRASNNAGGYTEVPTTVASIVGVLREFVPGEGVLFDKTTVRKVYRFYMMSDDIGDHTASLTEANTFVSGSTTYNIIGVHNVMNAGRMYVADLEVLDT